MTIEAKIKTDMKNDKIFLQELKKNAKNDKYGYFKTEETTRAYYEIIGALEEKIQTYEQMLQELYEETQR